MYLLPPGASEYETRFYSILSTEKTQDGRIVYTNTEMILKDLQKQLASGIEILLIEEILDGSDGCSEQYQCGTALYMLWKFSRGRDIIYDRAIDSPGHGKKQIDGYSGDDKKHLENEYTFNVESQLECVRRGRGQSFTLILIAKKDRSGRLSTNNSLTER